MEHTNQQMITDDFLNACEFYELRAKAPYYCHPKDFSLKNSCLSKVHSNCTTVHIKRVYSTQQSADRTLTQTELFFGFQQDEKFR
jgi:hypothetical protein